METERLEGLKEGDYVKISSERISLDALVDRVGAPEAGAISTFSGVTRNNFEGRAVKLLEYEAYTPMAEKEMAKIVGVIHKKWDVIKVAIVHRIGAVPIGEASIIIAISSAHRLEGLQAVHFAIDEVKAVVPVWKKEVYEDGHEWKQNKECMPRFCCHENRTPAHGDSHVDKHS